MALQNPLLPVTQDATETLPAVPPARLTGADLQRLRQSLDHSVSENTRAASAWRAFQAWAALTLPASPPLVAAYLSHLVEERRLAVATVRLHRAALAAMHRASGHPDPTDNEGSGGCSRASPGPTAGPSGRPDPSPPRPLAGLYAFQAA